MTSNPNDRTSLAIALAWASRLIAVSLEMVLPGVIGQWLDRRWNTQFLVIIGFVLGLVAGVFHLLVMVGAIGKRRDNSSIHKPQAKSPPFDDRPHP